MQNKTDILEPDFTYHVYNRTNGKELLFTEGDNYRHFLEKHIKYIVPIAETYCYCLMPNHFHFLIRIRSEGDLKESLRAKAGKDLTGFQNLSGLLSRQFSNFLNSYAKAFNKRHGREGALFNRPYKRKRVTDEQYFLKLVHYASNPEHWKRSASRADEIQNTGNVPHPMRMESGTPQKPPPVGQTEC